MLKKHFLGSGNSAIDLALDTISIGKQAFIFVNTKSSAEKTAEETANKLEKTSEKLKELSEKIEHVLSKPTKQCERLARCVKKGIAFHHAGLTNEQKSLIEDSFRAGLIKIICCTPTLCLSGDTKIWKGISETELSKFKNSNPLFALSKNKLIIMKSQKVQRIENFSKLIKISSVSDYSIKTTPNHRMLVKRKNRKMILQAKDINKNDKIATIGKLNISNVSIPSIKEFVMDNKTDFDYKFNPDLSYLIGLMLGDGYSGAETDNKKIRYKGSPSVVGIDDEIFSHIEKVCNQLKLSSRRSKTSNRTPQLVLGKNNWFREFLVRCGVEKKDKKYISKKLMTMSLENISWLLKGLFDTDGYLEKRAGPGFSNTSKKLVKQIQKLLLRFGIVSRIRVRKGSSMKIYEKEYKTMPYFELIINQKKSILDFYKFIGFNIQRKQSNLIDMIAKICSNLSHVSCDNCRYKIYKDLFSGRTKDQKSWGKIKLKAIKLLGEKGKLASRELKKLLNYEPKKKESRLNHHYELIKKRRIGSRSNTEWIWGLNPVGKWIFKNIINKDKKIEEFFRLRKCPLCKNQLEWTVKKGWRDSDFEGDIFWDMIRKIEEVGCERDVYDVVLPTDPHNSHMFVANGFIVHNSAGVDLPAYRVIIRDLRRFSFRGYVWIPVLEYMQMAGRAGRPSFDKKGQAIVVAKTEKEKEKIIDEYIHGEAEEIYSKLAVEPILRMYLLSLIATEFVNTKKSVMEFFSKTFYAHQFKDLYKIESIIMKILGLLEEWGFIKVENKLREFVSASELNENNENDYPIKATLLGKRVAELYIDPLTAHHIIQCLKKTDKEVSAVSLLQMICNTLEMRPLLRVKVKEYDNIQSETLNYKFLEQPETWNEDYEDWLKSVKTALFFNDWINENDDEYLLEKYNVRPGETRAKLERANWLLYSSSELSRMIGLKNILKDIVKLRFRIRYGVKEELLALLKLEGIGRVRARKLFNNGVKTIGDVKKSDIVKLAQLIGKKTAVDIKKQVGQEVKEVPKGKRKGQLSLRKY